MTFMLAFLAYWAGFLAVGFLLGALWSAVQGARRQRRARRAVASFRRHFS